MGFGELAERLNAPFSKNGISERGSQVQILYSPQNTCAVSSFGRAFP